VAEVIAGISVTGNFGDNFGDSDNFGDKTISVAVHLIDAGSSD